MTNVDLSLPDEQAANPQKLGPNEQAILNRVGPAPLRKALTRIVRLKMRLQFTGWLQYMLPLPVTLLVFLLAGLIRLLGLQELAIPFFYLGTLLLVILGFDLVTVKFRLRTPERLPQRKDHLDTFDLMRARRSCRSFQTRRLTPVDHEELMGYVQLHSAAPTIGEAPVRFEYVSAPLTVWPTVNATEFLVAIAPKEYSRLAVIDVGRSLQKIVMDATRMGLGTCWIGPGADQGSVARHLGERFDPQGDHIICVCAVGYKSWYVPMFLRIFNWQFKRRLPLSALFFADENMQEPLNLEAETFTRFGRNYEICQWAPSSYNGQTTRCVAVMEKNEERSARFDFYAVTASRYYAAVALGIWCANWEIGCEALDIEGHLVVLPDEERGIGDGKEDPQLPIYDVSWVLEEAI